MIDIKTIAGEQLVSVPILQDAVIHEELMASDYIALAWNSEDGRELPVGAYIEYEGERYSLYEPYTPTMVSEGEYRYNPHFHSREEAWKKQPACVYTYEDDGATVKSKEFDWTFVGSPADAMQIIKQAIKNEVGEDWVIAIADSLPATIEVSSQTSSIASILSDIAAQCETEYWVDKKESVIHLSKCERGEAIILEVGNNVGVPSVMSKGSEYFTRYYALGSTRNVTQVSGNINGAVNKRLTLDPNVFPMGYKDTKGHYENGVFVSDLEKGEIFSKVVLFDDIYPSSDLEIADVRPRMKYRLDGGKRVKIGGTDENPIYDQYAIWYFKIKDFTFSEDSLIEGLPLSVHFKSGRLSGQEFELIYHAKAKRENTDGDVIPFDVEAGDFEIKFKESSGIILPDIAYIIPQNADKITLFNVEMPSEYTVAAQKRLLEALDKVIAREHEDSNTYEVESNPVAFYETNMVVSLGQKTMFINGAKSLETRVLMVERRLDSPSEQKIRVGNDLIQGSTKELRENVESLNHNVDVLSAFNDLSKSIQDSYGRTQALINEAVASVLGIWILDENGNLVTEKQVVIKNNLIVEGDTASGGEGDPSTVVGATSVVVDGKSYHAKDGVIDMSEAFKGLNVDVDLSDYYTKEEVNELIDEVAAGDVDLTNYYTKNEVDSKFATIDLSPYAKSADVAQTYATIESLNGVDNRLKGIEGYFATSEDAGTQIDKWNEIVAFLNATEGTTLAGILATYYTKNEIDGKVTTINNSIISVDNKYASTKTWADTLASLIVNENGSVRIKANLIVDGDTSSGGEGGSSSVGIQGIVVNGTTYRDADGDGLIDLGTIGGGTLTEITYEMIVEALGYTPVSSASLGNYLPLAGGTISGGYSPLTINRNDGITSYITFSNYTKVLGYLGFEEDGPAYTTTNWEIHRLLHSGNYSDYALPLSGGTISGTSVAPLIINTSASDSSVVFRINSASKTQIGYNPSLGSFIYNYSSSKSIGIKDDGTPHFNGNTLIHSGNIGDYAAGSLVAQSTNNLDNATNQAIFSGTYQAYNRPAANYVTGITLYNTTVKYKHQLAFDTDDKLYVRSHNTTTWSTWKTIAFTDQVLLLDGSNARATKLTSSESLDNYKYGFYSYTNGNNPTNSFGDNTAVFAFTSNRGSDTWQIAFDGNGINNTAGPRFGIRGNFAGQGWTSWYRIATTDSNVASATKLATARTIWGQSFDGTGDVSGNLNLGTGAVISSCSGTDRLLIDFGSAGDPYFGYGTAGAGISSNICGNNIYLRYGTSRTAGLILNSSGNVGIGTTSPSFKLHVDGTAKINDIVRLGANLYVSQDSTAYGLQLWGDADGGYLGVHAKGSFKSTNMRFGYDGSATVYGNLVVQGDISA